MFLSNNVSASIEDERETAKSYSQMILANERNAKKAKMTINNVCNIEEIKKSPVKKSVLNMSVQSVHTEDFTVKKKTTTDKGILSFKL